MHVIYENIRKKVFCYTDCTITINGIGCTTAVYTSDGLLASLAATGTEQRKYLVGAALGAQLQTEWTARVRLAGTVGRLTPPGPHLLNVFNERSASWEMCDNCTLELRI